MHHYTGINRRTKDLDIFIRRQDDERVSQVLLQAGYQTEMVFSHWLGKVYAVYADDLYIDLVFNSGNGIAKVDHDWFAHASDAQVLGMPA